MSDPIYSYCGTSPIVFLYPSWQSYENTSLTDNNRSCVVKITSQFGSILLTGDIEKEAEQVLLAASLQANIDATPGDAFLTNNLKSDVLIAPHHGSKTSSTPEFIAAVGAKHTIFTVGYLNRFKHPKPLIVERYEASGAALYRSDYAGALLLNFNPSQGIQIEQWRNTHRKYWHDD